MTDEPNEQEFIRKAKTGDKDAFTALIKRHESKIYGLAFKLLGNHDDVKQVCQDVFLQAYENLFFFRGDSSFYTWLYKLTLNACHRFFRDYQTDPLFKPVPIEENPSGEDSFSVVLPADLSAASIAPFKEMEAKEEIESVRRAIASLPKKYYQAIILKDIQGYSYKDIAKILKVSEGTVMSRLHRGRLLLARQLVQNGGKEFLDAL